MIIIFGASGHAKEIEYIIRNSNNGVNHASFFVADDSVDAINGVPVISEEVLIQKILLNNTLISAYIAIGSSAIRKKIVNKFQMYNQIAFTTLLADGVKGDFDNITFGDGNIFFPGVQFTINIKIGNHNHFNLNTSVSHDCVIGNYNTFSPGVKIAGKVTIGNNSFFGINSSVVENVFVTNNVIIGAGATVIRDIVEEGTYVGTPARKIK